MIVYNIEKFDRCPALKFDGSIATCLLSAIIPIGEGCCIKARAYRNGVEYDFASLPSALKQSVAQKLLRKRGD